MHILNEKVSARLCMCYVTDDKYQPASQALFLVTDPFVLEGVADLDFIELLAVSEVVLGVSS